ncbi:MAG: TadE/TadG family type IV pilus assembly protein [Paraperlucidibaca sp.]
MTTRQLISQREHGATAIEFSIVFALLFGVFWAIISYAMPFFLYQVMNQATAESTRYSLRIDPTLSNSAIETLVNSYLQDKPLSVLPSSFRTILNTANPSPSLISTKVISGISYRTLTVTLRYPGCSTTTQSTCIVPAINLFGVSIPKLGEFIATADVHLERTP